MEFTSSLWSAPFLGIILSMSFLPLIAPSLWNKYSCYVPAFWSLVYLSSVAYVFGFAKIFPATIEPLLVHYLPFIVLISALYITSGGIFVDFPRGYGPIFNVLFLFFGSIVAGWIGTTGAAMLLIRPFLRANAERKYKTHLIIFFIFLIANIGGAATPLGDPPLFIGFLEGIDFFWFIKKLYKILFCSIISICTLFFIIDAILFKIDPGILHSRSDKPAFVIQGTQNVFLIIMILLAVIFCNFNGEFSFAEGRFKYSSLIRNSIISLIALISLKITSTEIRQKNCFSFAPIREVAEFFAGIFITVTPIIYILHQGVNGEFRNIFAWMAPGGQFIAERCFWASGMLSSMLDNAPTFLIFFHLLSGNAVELMTTKSHLLTAISISTVFMGAMTYIGNAPNLMVKSISKDYGVKVPSFLGYIVWSVLILVPFFWVIAKWL